MEEEPASLCSSVCGLAVSGCRHWREEDVPLHSLKNHTWTRGRIQQFPWVRGIGGSLTLTQDSICSLYIRLGLSSFPRRAPLGRFLCVRNILLISIPALRKTAFPSLLPTAQGAERAGYQVGTSTSDVWFVSSSMMGTPHSVPELVLVRSSYQTPG